MKKSGTMLQTEITEAMPSKKGGWKRKLKIAVCIIVPLLCLLAILLLMTAEVTIDYGDLEGGISVTEQNGYYLFKAKVPVGRFGTRETVEKSEYTDGSDTYYMCKKICFVTSRYHLWFGKKQEETFYVISNDGRVSYGPIPQQMLDELLASEYKSSQESQRSPCAELDYCEIQLQKRPGTKRGFPVAVGESEILWKLDPDE